MKQIVIAFLSGARLSPTTNRLDGEWSDTGGAGEPQPDNREFQVTVRVQPADIGLPTGNGKKLSCSQAQLGQATGLAVASFLSISCGPSYARRL